ncbi:MAG: glycosyltransferase [Terrimicrobiaceae bacterium]
MRDDSDEPLVSVVIPTYNHAHFLGKALRSVIGQTYTRWEALVVDNHSGDNTAEVVAGLNDPRISLLQINNHGVIAASRNLGISESQGEWVAFLDSDDRWYPEKLERCAGLLREEFDLVCHGERWLGNERDRQVFYGPEQRATYRSLLLDGNCLSTSAVVMKAETARAVGGFSEDAEIVTAEDYDFWLRLAKAGARIGFVREILGEYAIHSGNQTRGVIRHTDAVLAVLDRHFSSGPENLAGWQVRKRRAIAYYGGARGLQDDGHHREAWRYFWKAVSTWPFFARTYAAILMNLFRKKILVS